MAKTLYFTSPLASIHRGNNDAKLAGATTWWQPQALSESRGTGGAATVNSQSIAGTTVGIEFTVGALAVEWISEPLSADFTIAGTITGNMWGYESTMNDNTAINFVVDKIDGATGAITQIAKSARVTELAITTAAVNNFTVAPTSTACKRGDRIRIRPFIDDAGAAMVVGTSTFSYNGATAAVAGDSYVTFTENLTFELAGDPGSAALVQGDNSSSNGNPFGRASAGTARADAQPFVALSASLTEVRASLNKAGTPTDNVVLEIQTDSAGIPSGSVVGTVATVAGTSLTTTLTEYIYSTSITVTQGNTYWLVFRRDGALSDTNFYSDDGSTSVPSGWLASKKDLGASGGWTVNGFSSAIALKFSGIPVSTYYLTDTASSPTLSSDENTDISQVSQVGGTTLFTRIGQRFVAKGNLTSVSAWIGKTGAPSDNVIVEIQSDTSGSPSGTAIGTVATIAPSSLTTSAVEQVLSCSITLTPGTAYWLVFRRVGAINGSNYFNVWKSAYGELYKIYDGSVWSTSTFSISSRFIFSSTGKSASLTRGSSSTNAVTNTAAGPTPGIQVSGSAGGTPLEWYTQLLEAFTLGGKAKFNIRALESAAGANASLKAEIAITAGNGSGATVWGVANLDPTTTSSGGWGELSTSQTSCTAWVIGDDTAITAGQRLRFRVFLDDCADLPQASGFTVTVSYNGTTPAAAGDTYVILPVAVTESGPAAKPITPATISNSQNVSGDVAELQRITPTTGITNTNSVSGAVTKPPVFRPIVPAGITNNQSVSGAIGRRRPVTPTTTVTFTNNASGAVRRIAAVTPAGITNSQTVSGAVVKRAAVVPAAVSNTNNVSGSIQKFTPAKPIVPTGITNTNSVSGAIRTLRRIAPLTVVNNTQNVSGSVGRLRPIPATAITNTQNVTGSIRALKRVGGAATNTQTVTGAIVVRRTIGTGAATNTNSVSGLVTKPSTARPITPTTTVTNTNSVSGAIRALKRIAPTTTVTNNQTVSGSIRVARGVLPTGITFTNSVSGAVRKLARITPTTTVTFTTSVVGSVATRPIKSIIPAGITFTNTASGRIGKAGVFTPDQVTGLGMWLDASTLALSNGADVFVWPDLSGLGHDVSCRVGTDNPPAFVTNVYNGLPVIRFVHANAEFLFNSTSMGTVGEIFVVAKYNSATFADYDGLFGDTGVLLLLGNSGLSSFYPSNAGSPTYYYNGVDSTSTRQAPMGVLGVCGFSFTPFAVTPVIGVDRFNWPRFWDGDMAEIVTYDHILTSTERAQVTTYLRDKWLGPPPVKPIAPSSGAINNSQAVSGAIVRRVTVTTATVTNSQSVAGAIGRRRPIAPGGITNTNATSGSIRALKRVAPTGITNTQTVSGAVRKLARIAPITTVTNTQSVAGFVTTQPIKIISPQGITNTQSVTGSIRAARAIRPTTTVTFTNNASGNVRRLAAVLAATVANTNTVSGNNAVLKLVAVKPGAATNTQTVTGSIKMGRGVRPTTNITYTTTVSGSIRKLVITPSTGITYTNTVSGNIRRLVKVTPTTTITYTNTVTGGIVRRFPVKPTVITYTNNIFGGIKKTVSIRPSSNITWTNNVTGSIVSARILISASKLYPGRIVTSHRGKTMRVVGSNTEALQLPLGKARIVVGDRGDIELGDIE